MPKTVIKNEFHGLSQTGTYRSWYGMKNRCLNPNTFSYYRYGGRGIKIYNPWIKSFKAFYDDMGPRPEGTSLDRIDVDDHYKPENCRWATNVEQAREKKKEILYVTKSL